MKKVTLQIDYNRQKLIWSTKKPTEISAEDAQAVISDIDLPLEMKSDYFYKLSEIIDNESLHKDLEKLKGFLHAIELTDDGDLHQSSGDYSMCLMTKGETTKTTVNLEESPHVYFLFI